MIRALLVAGLLTLAFAGQAHALPSDVKLGCLSGSTALGPAPPAGIGSGACTLTPSASGSSANNTSGMGSIFRPVMSADGRNLYAITGANLFSSTNVAVFNRNAVTGALTFAGCVSGDTAQTACTPIPSATAGAGGSGMSGLSDLAIAPDGKNVYAVAASDDAITTFSRSTTTGALTFLECDTGDTAVISASCAGVPAASANGANSGLDQLNRLAVSPVNDFVAATSSGDDAGVSFVRNAATGALTIEGCVTGETESSPAGNGACAPHPGGTTAGGAGSGFDQLRAVTYSPDGLNLYAASFGDDTVTTLARPNANSTTGFTFAQCMSGSIAMGPAPAGNNRCNLTTAPTANGTNSDLDGPLEIAVPNDGLDVLVAATATDPGTGTTSNSVTTFGRGQAPLSPIGTLALPTCLTSVVAVPCTQTPVTGNFSGLHTPGDIAVAPDNTTVLVAAGGVFTTSAQSLTTLTRNVTSGAIAFNRCIAADTAAGPGGSGACSLLASATPGGGNSGQAAAGGVVVSPDNRHVYVPGFFDAAITWYGNDADADTVGDSIDNCPAAANTNQSDLDADGTGDVCDATPTGPPGPAPPGPTTLAPGGPAATPAPAASTPAPAASAPPSATGKPASSALSFPAQMKVRRASVALRGGRRTLRVDATVSTRADGRRVTINYRSSGVTTRRTVTVVRGRIRATVRLPATQPLNTGVVALSLGAAAGLRAQQVIVRAADRPAALKVKEARILNKKLRVSGTISPLATGVVLIRIDYSDKQGNALSATARARIFNGTWKTLQGLEPDARDGGVVTILYPGLARSPLGPIRGEQDARVLGVGR